MNRKSMTGVILLGLIGLPACKLFQNDGKGFTEERSSLQRLQTPDASPEEIAALASGNTDFAIELYRRIGSTTRKNIFFSPFSIVQASSMAYAGARGATASQMAAALHFSLSADRHHSAFNALDLKLRANCLDPGDPQNKLLDLILANALWSQKGYALESAFLDILALHYDAGLNLLDFLADPETARLTINRWVSNQTSGKIADLLQPGSIATSTRLVLTNAIYFKAAWESPFDAEETRTGTFHRLDGISATVSMMNQTWNTRYARLDGCQTLELPYEGGTYSLLLILPDEGNFAGICDDFTGGELARIREALTDHQVELSLPKFRVDFPLSLKPFLTSMGMSAAFDPDQADFSGIIGRRELFVGDVVHRAFVGVDEKGTEAAAATAVIFYETSFQNPVRLLVDRPFLFLIQDRETGTILFLGQITEL